MTIYYRLVEGGTRYGKEAADIVETDIIDEITVGDSGLIGNQQTGTLTIEDGGDVDVDGTFTIRPLATLNLNGGTLRVGAFDNQGTFNENGGTLIVPEPAATGVAALLALALVARRRRRCRPA